MEDSPFIPEFNLAEDRGLSALRDVLQRNSKELKRIGFLDRRLCNYARDNKIEAMSLLIEFGAEINAPAADHKPEGAILDAARAGAVEALRWLLDHGANINFQIDGITRCISLTGAVVSGHLEIVKILVEHGADFNAVWADQNALSFALMYEKKEIEAYLRSIGAKEPWELAGAKSELASAKDAVFKHIKKHLGQPQPLSLQEIVPGEPAISVHVVPADPKKKGRNRICLVTCGMSDKPMTVPAGSEDYRFAELVMFLPPDWPLTDKALKDPNNFWPIEWIRRIARYPHENNTWLGGKAAVIANEEPPAPFAPGVKFTCMLLLTEVSKFGWLWLKDGRRVPFYTLIPLYTEERDLEKEKGTEHLVKLFAQHDIDPVVDVGRVNVALLKAESGERRDESREKAESEEKRAESKKKGGKGKGERD